MPLSISQEFADDLSNFLNKLTSEMEYINAEIDQSKKIIFRVSVTFHPFEDVANDIIMCIDSVLILLTITLRKLVHVIDKELYGWISKNGLSIIAEMKAHMKHYKNLWKNYMNN